MIYFNQNNYANVKYPAPGYPNATIKTGGCGPTSMAMILSNLIGKVVEPPTMAAFAIQHGARVSGGTDMTKLAKAVCEHYHLSFRTTTDESILVNHMKSGGMAIANVGGNHGTYKGLYSDGGHFIAVVGITPDGRLMIMDPGYYAGKYDKAGRKGKVVMQGNISFCPVATLAADTEISAIEYWLFTKEDEDMLEPVKITINGQPLPNGHLAKLNGEDKAFAPAKLLAEALGAKVDWDAKTSTVVITK